MTPRDHRRTQIFTSHNHQNDSYEAAMKRCYGWGSPQHAELYERVAALGRLRTPGLEGADRSS